ncbi:30S ribosomal protein S20 [candidate division GN15 bacterium]|nr:30S ribosomal protein S20 [candidate division GN15 bacterium]
MITLPNHKSAKKRVKTNEKRRQRNRASRSELRSAISSLRSITNREEAIQRYGHVTSLLDRAVNSGLLHKSTANRRKSRLARSISRLG